MQEKITRITSTTIIAGVDVAKKEHWARITDYRGVDLAKPVKVRSTLDGFEKLMVRVEKVRVAHGCDKVVIRSMSIVFQQIHGFTLTLLLLSTTMVDDFPGIMA